MFPIPGFSFLICDLRLLLLLCLQGVLAETRYGPTDILFRPKNLNWNRPE